MGIPPPPDRSGPPVTVTIGIATAIPADGMQAEELLRQAESAVRSAKDDGRNRVITYAE